MPLQGLHHFRDSQGHFSVQELPVTPSGQLSCLLWPRLHHSVQVHSKLKCRRLWSHKQPPLSKTLSQQHKLLPRKHNPQMISRKSSLQIRSCLQRTKMIRGLLSFLSKHRNNMLLHQLSSLQGLLLSTISTPSNCKRKSWLSKGIIANKNLLYNQANNKIKDRFSLLNRIPILSRGSW